MKKNKTDLKTYRDYGCVEPELDVSKVKFTKFIIIVPTENDKKELQAAFRHIHNAEGVNSDYVAVNQISHCYLDEKDSLPSIVVDEKTFNKVVSK